MKNVPTLRFQEFSESWMFKKIGDITSLVKDGSHGTHQDVERGPYLLSAKNIKNGKIVIQDDDRKISEEEYNAIYKNYSLEVGDVLLSIVGTIGRVAIVKEIQPIAFQRSVAILRFNKMNSKFIECCMNNTGFQNDLLKYQVVSAQPGIYLNDLKKLKIYFPDLEEQEKIASFFSLIDKKIELQTEKVEELKNYKKGIMQKIFSQELRFKDENGSDYPEWKENNLEKLIKVKSIRNKDNKVELVLSVSNTKGFITQAEQFEDRVVASSDISNYKIVEKDDFAFNPARINVGSIARLKTHEKGIISPMYVCFNCLKSLDSSYFEYFLTTHSFDVQMKKKLEGSVRQTLSAEALSEIKIKLPTLLEQKKIGSVLNKINEKIETEELKLVQLSQYKKGLLQQMFI